MTDFQLTIDTSESLLTPLALEQDGGLAAGSDTDSNPHPADTNPLPRVVRYDWDGAEDVKAVPRHWVHSSWKDPSIWS